MYNIVHLLILGSLLVGSEIFFMFNIFYIFLYFYIFHQQVSTLLKQQVEHWN